MALLVKYNILNTNFPLFFIYLIFISALICIGFIDLEHQIIPDVISIPGIIAGLFFSFLIHHIPWIDSVTGILAGGGILYLVAFLFELITKKEGMGGGDIKLLAMIGAFLDGRHYRLSSWYHPSAQHHRRGSLMLSKKGIRTKIPFGPFLALVQYSMFFSEKR
jgi:leader peptidase (prepilin peptidase)/N-methyltransferase